MFKDGQIDVHDKERSGQPSAVSDNLLQSVNQNICERRRLTISEFSREFPQISHTLLYKIITVRLGYRQFCAKWVLKMQRRASAFVDFFSDTTKTAINFPITSYE
jgi:hypothetical protein